MLFWAGRKTLVHRASGNFPAIFCTELTRLLISVFSTLYAHVEFRKVRPVDYKLFQVADLICTTEMIEEKAEISRSELDFFRSKRDFRKNYFKSIRKKQL